MLWYVGRFNDRTKSGHQLPRPFNVVWSTCLYFTNTNCSICPNHTLNPSITPSPDLSLTPEAAQTLSEWMSAVYSSLSLQSDTQAVQLCPHVDPRLLSNTCCKIMGSASGLTGPIDFWEVMIPAFIEQWNNNTPGRGWTGLLGGGRCVESGSELPLGTECGLSMAYEDKIITKEPFERQ